MDIRLTREQFHKFVNLLASKIIVHHLHHSGCQHLDGKTFKRAVQWVMGNYFSRYLERFVNLDADDSEEYSFAGTKEELYINLYDVLTSHAKEINEATMQQILNGLVVLEVDVTINNIELHNIHDITKYPRYNPQLQP